MNSYFRSTFAIALCAMLGTWAMAAENVKIPVGTSVQVRITEKLSSETANVGEVFHGSLAAPVVAKGRTLFPKGAIVTGEVVNLERSGRLSTPGELHLSLRTIRTGGRTYPVSVQPVVIKGELSGSEDLYVDGQVEGSISLKSHSLTVGPNGQVKASVEAKGVVVQGKLEGNVQASDRVELRKSAVVTGDITQIDLPGDTRSGLKVVREILTDICPSCKGDGVVVSMEDEAPPEP